MKIKAIIFSVVAGITMGGTFTSCSDMLSPDSERHAYDIAQDTLYSYWGILKSFQNIGERYVVLGECRGELIDGTGYLSDSIQTILNFDMDAALDGSNRFLKASDYYHVINSCNAYLASVDTDRKTGTNDPYMLKEAAQVEAIRAWTYLQLIQVYGEVPFYTEPLLSTDNINSFMANTGKVMANADNLADLLGPSLDQAALIEKQYGYPSYENYGYTTNVCHSSKAMIPLCLILGDLYLTKGDPVSCAKAAQYYYDYLGCYQGQGHIAAGGTLPSGYNFMGYKSEGADKPEYLQMGAGSSPWTEKGAQSRTNEAITAIPSSTNKLWGNVLRGVNELFGYDAEISVRTSEEDTTTTASVYLTPQYDKKQLTASEEYFNLCKAQDYEIYITSNAASDIGNKAPDVDPSVGDARQYWVRDVYQIYSNGLLNTEKFITKQNPGGIFTTVFPMIYRKSMVWLRYAEALNRAGYPSFAFAILKNGLCNSEEWYPTSLNDYAVKAQKWTIEFEDATFTSEESLEDVVEQAFATVDTEGLTEEEIAEKKAEITALAEVEATDWYNYPADGTNAILYYLDKREALNTPSFLNFKFDVFDGNVRSQSIPFRTSFSQRGFNSYSPNNDIPSDNPATVGIHSHGCGILKYDEKQSRYNYVDKVIEKAALYGKTITKEDIYSGDYDDLVKDCVEDLIVDEEALELAFEGTRFFDLMRVAHRRGDASYLANRLAKRNAALASKLSNPKNWYFPLPR